MKFEVKSFQFSDLILAFFLISAALAAPIDSDEVIEDAIVVEEPVIEDGPMALPQIEEGVVEVEEAAKGDDEDEVEDAEAAFMRMMGYGMSAGGYPAWSPMQYGMFNPMDMMMGGMGMYNPMMNYPMMGGMNGMYNPMDMMMGGMGGMNGMYNPMMNYPMMDPMGGMGGMGGMYNPMMDPMGGMGGMGGMYNPMMDQMMGGGMGGPLGYNYEPKKPVSGMELPFRNVDYPTDYTLECSDHCACEQVCKFN